MRLCATPAWRANRLRRPLRRSVGEGSMDQRL
jgi:hypothetical protein